MKPLAYHTVCLLMVLAGAGCVRPGATPGLAPGVAPSAAPSVAPSARQKAPDLTGRWSGADWGTVTLEGFGESCTGSYTGSYGRAPTKIELRWTGGRSFVGTWREGTYRSGWLELTLAEDGATCSGTWGADERCEHLPSSPASALFTWSRGNEARRRSD